MAGGAALLVAAGLMASDVSFFTISSREGFLGGELDGVSADSLGVLRLAQRVARVGELEEPFVFSAARRGEGWVLGTGNSGRVLALTPDGVSSILLETREPTVFAVATDAYGVVWAGG